MTIGSCIRTFDDNFFIVRSVPMILVGSNLCNVLLITVEHLEVIGMHSLSLKDRNGLAVQQVSSNLCNVLLLFLLLTF